MFPKRQKMNQDSRDCGPMAPNPMTHDEIARIIQMGNLNFINLTNDLFVTNQLLQRMKEELEKIPYVNTELIDGTTIHPPDGLITMEAAIMLGKSNKQLINDIIVHMNGREAETPTTMPEDHFFLTDKDHHKSTKDEDTPVKIKSKK